MFARKELFDGGLLRDFADLRGKRIAVAATGTTADVVVGRALELFGGLTLADAEILELAYPDMAAAMVTNAIDVGVAPDPAASLAVQRGGAVIWRASDFVPGPGGVDDDVLHPKFITQPGRKSRATSWSPSCSARASTTTRSWRNRRRRRSARRYDMIARRTGLTDRALLERVQVGYHIDPNGALERQDHMAADYEWFRPEPRPDRDGGPEPGRRRLVRQLRRLGRAGTYR